MADESVYAAGGESNKRKYEDSPPPVGRRSTGFSSPPDSAAPPSSYNSVPPPMNEIELAKQKAQEIAARLLSNADPSKRARVESNGAGGGSGGFDAVDTGVSHKHPGLGLGGPPQSYGQSYGGYPGPSKKIEIPNGRVGVIIGKGGDTIKYLQLQSGAKIQVTRDMDADPSSTTRGVELMGTPDQIAKAEQLINDVLSEAEAGGSGIVSRRLTGQPSITEQIILKIANNKVGLVIGKGGETIKSMQARTGARIQVIPLHLPPGDTSKERTVQIDGTSEQIEAARQLVEEVTSSELFLPMKNRMRNQSMSGGYSQQGYHRPPNNWQQPGPPSQQPGYGYVQPGAYPGPPQYGMNQPPYPGYPQPGSGGYGSGWDQSSAQNQHAAQGGSYDYYNQQAPPQQQQSHGAPVAQTDGSAYGYSQSSAYGQGQGYGQDGYGGYHAGYGQPQQNPNGGYDKQQQGYGSAYGNAPNRTPDGHTPPYGTQSDPNQASATGQSSYNAGQPSPNPSYPHQASSQPGYGAPPSSQGGGYGTQPPYGSYGTPPAKKPGSQPAYGQSQQSPSAQGGGYTQPGYPPVQSGYGQSDSGAQRPPSSSGYPSQPGYGAPPYGAPPPSAQTGYGQQQPPQYGGAAAAYGGGYSQPPPAYASETTPPQSAQSGGGTASKASPPS